MRDRPIPVDRVADAVGLVTRPDVDVVVELIGGIEPARSLVLSAMESGASVVSAQATTRAPARGASAVPTPASVLGFEPGTDRKLPTWKQVNMPRLIAWVVFWGLAVVVVATWAPRSASLRRYTLTVAPATRPFITWPAR